LTVIFADLELARRLERPEAVAGARIVEARSRLSPDAGAQWIEAGGVYAMFDGPESPVTQTFGLGLFAEPASADLDRLESFFQERGAPVRHEVSPLAGVPAADLLCGRGYRPIEFTSVMFKPLLDAAAPPDPPNHRLQARLMVKGEEELWSQTMARGWAEQPEFTESLLGLGRLMASIDGLLAFFAHLDGAPVAAGVLHCHEGVALFGGASTVPEARNRGAQRALFEARMQMASSRGCDLAMVCAHPGSASQRNAERQGFRIAYTRIKWQLAPKG
jgi:GNAT superfamily N-acetyltransferase